MSLTQARRFGSDTDGRMLLAPEGRSQLSVYRETAAAGSPLVTASVLSESGRFVRQERRRPSGGSFRSAPLVRVSAVADPTAHPTFVTPASRPLVGSGRPVWSDLSYAEADAHLPERDRRVVVTAMRAIEDGSGHFLGIVRTGLGTEALDRIVGQEQERARPNRVVLCDEEGRLLARLSPDDPLVEQPDDSLRVEPSRVPEEIARALADPSLRQIRPDHLEDNGRFELRGRPFLVSFRGLPDTQGWRVGVVVAEDELPGVAEQTRRGRVLLAFALGVSALILGGGILTLRTVRGGLGQVEASASRMRQFDFAPASPRSVFRDVQGVMEGLELAKTAMRAMSKYVPIDLVRLLYRTGREPVLGGELARVSLLFSDIKDFTTLSEQLSPDELARLLGRYLETMTAAIQGTQGTIDKYIGDGIMAVWNVPTPCADHPRHACEAALRARAAGERLYASPEWGGWPPLVTRFGLHTDEVMVGHFGAPDRLSYTCLGDGVNLASRLEGLNKQYGTTILVSEPVREVAGESFVFRLVDAVAVKGKRQGVRVYELLSAEEAPPRTELIRRYEEAFAAYLARDFRSALARVEPQVDDGPSRVLAERCRRLLQAPPPPDWDGVWSTTSK